MKPTFALDFRDGAIALLHRTSRGWLQVGGTSFDAPDLAEALGYLRSTALGLSPRGISTKLVIPNDQILYTQVHAPGPDAAKRKKQIKAALAGLTPYAVDDLVFDWWGSGPEVQVAVIARETLAEAEAFAAEHRFNPVSFVAVPENGDFRGEPFFGPTAMAPSLLAEGQKVERDQDPIAVVARDFPRAEPEAESIAEPAAPEPAVAAPAAQPEPEAAPEPAAPQPVERPEPAPPELPAEAPPPELPAEAPPPELEPEPAPETPPGPEFEPEPEFEPDPLTPFDVIATPFATTSTFDPIAFAVALVDEAPMAVDVVDAAGAPEPAPPAAAPDLPVAKDDLPPVPPSAIRAAFASRRAGDATTASPVTEAAAGKTPTLGPAPAQRPTVPRPALTRPAGTTPETASSRAPQARGPMPKPTAPGKALRGIGALVTAPGMAGKRTSIATAPAPVPTPAETAVAAAKSQARPMTGLGGRPVPGRGKPRFLGLILTGVLLVFLALVAAWSSFFLAGLSGDQQAAPATEAVAANPAPADAAGVPAAADEAAADLQDPEAAADGVAPDGTATDSAAATAEPAPSSVVVGAAANATAPGDAPQDEIFLAAVDRAPQSSDPLTLPIPEARGDPVPATAAPPPPYGTVYQFDADGRIIPTPEGIITPEGVLLIAGPPALVPPVRPATIAAIAAANGVTLAAPADGAAATALATAPTEPTFPSDPALASFRPRARPADFAPVAPTAGDGASLGPAPDSRIAALRPLPRPQSVMAAGNDARQASAAASLAVSGAEGATSLLAISVSPKPTARPEDLSRAVEAAVAAAVQEPQPDVVVQDNASPSGDAEAQAEPEAESAAPTIPVNASVAKQATYKRAINLSRINLIGIYGTESSRYALIRQPNGTYKKVRVGDSIDGGKIAAITATEVRYQKGGRLLTLALPKSG